MIKKAERPIVLDVNVIVIVTGLLIVAADLIAIDMAAVGLIVRGATAAYWEL
jgi:hypothetical protein